jgi:uncharacterized FlaG/YvyC family protein
MGQISIAPISQVKNTADAEPQTQAVPTETRETTRQVAAAVNDLNAVGYAGQGREITFSVDRETKLPVVKVIDAKSKEVIQQWPRDYVLQLAAQLHHKGLTG